MFLKKLRYKFENSLSKGSIAVFFWLMGFMFFIMLLYSITLQFFERMEGVENPKPFLQAMYESYYQLLSPYGVATWNDAYYFRLLMGILCLIGMFIASMLVGLVYYAIADKIEEIKRGRSRIMESNHIVIYGWTSKIFLLLEELITANANVRRSVITILADRDKVEMETEIREKIGSHKNTTIIVRTGNPTDIDDVTIVEPDEAKSIIILPTDNEDSDMDVIKTLMALVNNPSRKKGAYKIVTEIDELSKLKVAKIIGGDELSVIRTTDIISRIMVQTCRQPGLSSVYTEILSFHGSEIYIVKDPVIYGKTFRELLFGFEHVSVIGIKYKDGAIALNIDPSYVVKEGEHLIVIMEDDDKLTNFSVKPNYGIIESAIHKNAKVADEKDKTLLIGWNNKAFTIIAELDKYVAPGSELMILSYDEALTSHLGALKADHKNLTIDSKIGDTSDIDFLESVGLNNYNHVIVLSYDTMEPHHADSWTLITLVQLRSLAEKVNPNINIVSEMLDMRNKTLAELAKPDDFVISDNITSLMLAQVSENSALESVYTELFDADGCEIYLKPIADYIEIDREVNFYTLLEAASRRNEIAIGYRTQTGKEVTIITNPSKGVKTKFEATDRLIVISGE